MRLIDGDAIYAEIDKFRDVKNMNGFELIQLDCTLAVIKHAKTIDPVKHGHWEESKCLDDCFWVCSCCKFPSQAIAAPKLYKYCPNCGARMDGDSK